MTNLDLTSLGLDDTQRAAVEAQLAHLDQARQAAETSAALSSRQSAILRVGVDTSTPAGKFFADHYDGDVSDEVALRQAALDLNVPLAGQTPVIPDSGDDGSTAARNALSQGTSNAGDNSEDPRQVAKNMFDQSLAGGSTRVNAMADAFRSRAVSAYETRDTRGTIL